MSASNDQSPPGGSEPLQRETVLVYGDRHRLGLLLVMAALGGVGVGFGLASVAYRARPATLRISGESLGGPRVMPWAGPGGCMHGPRALPGGARLGVLLDGRASSPGRSGARVRRVEPGSPAEAAGLEAGDVIVSIAGEPVAGPADVVRAVGARRPGQTVEVEVLRDGERRTLSVTLAAAGNDNAPR